MYHIFRLLRKISNNICYNITNIYFARKQNRTGAGAPPWNTVNISRSLLDMVFSSDYTGHTCLQLAFSH